MFVLGKVIDGSGTFRVDRGFMRGLFVKTGGRETLNCTIEASQLLWVKFDTNGELSQERATAAIVDGMIGDYDGINNITGGSISSKEEFNAFIKELWNDPRSKRGRPRSIPGDYRTYSFEEFCVVYPDAYVRAKKKWHRPTQAQVAEEMEPITLSGSSFKGAS